MKSLRDTAIGEVDAAVERQQERALARYEAEQDQAEQICEFAGHEWGDAGGGLQVCLRCEAESWEQDAA